MKLLENTNIKKHAIKLVKGIQPLYGSIYSLGPGELKMLKAYINTNLKTVFFWPF